MNALFDQSRRKASCIDPHNCGAAPKKVVTRGYRTMMRVRAPARERQNFLGRGETRTHSFDGRTEKEMTSSNYLNCRLLRTNGAPKARLFLSLPRECFRDPRPRDLWSSALSLDERFKSELGIEWESRATLDAATPRQHGLDVGPHRGLLLTVLWRRSRAGLAVLQ